VLRLLEGSDCPYRAIGKETQYCGVPSGRAPRRGTTTSTAA